TVHVALPATPALAEQARRGSPGGGPRDGSDARGARLPRGSGSRRRRRDVGGAAHASRASRSGGACLVLRTGGQHRARVRLSGATASTAAGGDVSLRALGFPRSAVGGRMGRRARKAL